MVENGLKQYKVTHINTQLHKKIFYNKTSHHNMKINNIYQQNKLQCITIQHITGQNNAYHHKII